MLIAVVATACIKDKDLPQTIVNEVLDSSKIDSLTIGQNSLIINEFVAKGCKSTDAPPCITSPTYTTTGSANGKWFELKNMMTRPLTLEEGHWYFSDTLGTVTKFKVIGSSVSIQSKGFAIVCADNQNMVDSKNIIHTNFSLNSDSGAIAIYYNADTSNHDLSKFIRVNKVRYSFARVYDVNGYSNAVRHKSYGRSLNRNTYPLVPLDSATPGRAN